RAARSRDRQFRRGRARWRDPRLCRALSISRREERRVRLPRGGTRVSLRGLRRTDAACLRRARQKPEAAQALRPDHARRALVSRAGLSARGRDRAAFAAPGALQLAPRLEGVFEAHLGAGILATPLV